MFISYTVLWKLPETLDFLVLGTLWERGTGGLYTLKNLVSVVASLTKCR